MYGFPGNVTLLSIMVLCLPAIGQESSKPIEYIESSSPLPGGGVVSSVYVPGAGGPVYDQRPVREATMRQSSAGQSIIDPNLKPINNQSWYVQPTGNRVAQGFNPGVYRVPVTARPVPAAAQVPGLGVPTSWNRTLRPNSPGYNPGAQGYGTVSRPPPVYPSAASIQPTLGSAPPLPGYSSRPALSHSRQSFQPIVPLQNFPPNAYAGQGVFGSPKLFVDGQPVRNLLRYLIVP